MEFSRTCRGIGTRTQIPVPEQSEPSNTFVDRRISRLFPVDTGVGEEEVGVAHLEVEAPVWLAILLQLDERFYIILFKYKNSRF